MEINKFQISNIGRFSSLEIPLAPTAEKRSNVTVFVGNNGAGKTSLLKPLAISLSWFVARVRSEKGKGSPIAENDIKNDTPAASIKIEVKDEGSSGDGPTGMGVFEWTLAKTRRGRKSDLTSSLSTITRLADYYRERLTNEPKFQLPLIAYYSVERGVLEIPLRIKGKHSFEQLDGYEGSLTEGVDFRRFFEWFREREDTENEAGPPQEVFEQWLETVEEGSGAWNMLSQLQATSRDRQLMAVRSAIRTFMPGFKNLRIRRKPKLHMSIDKAGETLDVAQLSQGEKSLMALVGDIARRLAMMNPALENPLHGDGVILIDEVDLHLHPKWQRSVIARLVQTFPNCQFVLTTHSPLVISDSKEVLCYLLDDGELTVMDDLYGLDANQVLLKVMDTDIRNAEINSKISDLLEKVQDGKLSEAQSLLQELGKDLPEDHIELMKARLLIRKLELRHAQNQ
ncbi:MAG: AAA family ATPase [Thermodesulfobacteriota bacterium]|nr:AAA family ATPase [Thermodesulfobacteriota bacterium]